MHELDAVIQHYGVKGMKWGVRRTRDQIDAKLKSMKRERSWSKILKDIDKMSNEEMNLVARRISLENDLKRLTKGRKVARQDKDDYLRRDKMSDQVLTSKVVRLRAKDNLKRNISNASKEQREAGETVARVFGPVALKYALTGHVTPRDLAISALNPTTINRKIVGKDARDYLTEKLKGEGRINRKIVGKDARDYLKDKFEEKK